MTLWLLFTIKDNDFRVWLSSLKEGDSNGNTEIPALSIGEKGHSNEDTEAGIVVRGLGTGWGGKDTVQGLCRLGGTPSGRFYKQEQEPEMSYLRVSRTRRSKKRCMRI